MIEGGNLLWLLWLRGLLCLRLCLLWHWRGNKGIVKGIVVERGMLKDTRHRRIHERIRAEGVCRIMLQEGISQVRELLLQTFHPESLREPGHHKPLSPHRQEHRPPRRRQPRPIRIRHLHLLINQHILLLDIPPPAQHNLAHRPVLRVLHLPLQQPRRIPVERAAGFHAVAIALVEVRVIVHVGGTEETLCVAAGAAHFIAAAFFEEGFLAGVAFADEGLGHGFFDLMFCVEVFFFVEFLLSERELRTAETGEQGVFVEGGRGGGYFRRREGGEILRDNSDSFLFRTLRSRRFCLLDPPLSLRRSRMDSVQGPLTRPTINAHPKLPDRRLTKG